MFISSIIILFSSQLCTRNCFFGAFAREANCGHSKVVDLPEQQMEVWNITKPCYLTVGSKYGERESEEEVKNLYQVRIMAQFLW